MVWVDSFKDVLPALESGRADVASAAITINEERKERFDFASAKYSPLSASLSEHIAKIKSSGIYFRLLETYLGSKAAAIVQAGSR